MPLRPIFAAMLIVAAPALAQGQSDGYKFLQAVREAKGDEVLAMLNRPGSTIINTRDVTSGDGALHITVRRGDVLYTNTLLLKGADVNIRDARGNTPMLIAVEVGRDDLVQLLAARGGNPNLANSAGETPLIRAVQRRDQTLVRTLLNAKADPDQRDVLAGLSARDYAARDTRLPTPIARLFADAPKVTKRAVSGPKL